MLQRDLYVPAGDISFWQAAIRDTSDPLYSPLHESVRSGKGISVDILYGDHEGGQRTITRFYLTPRTRGVNARATGAEQEPWLWVCATARHWNLDQADPRQHPDAPSG